MTSSHSQSIIQQRNNKLNVTIKQPAGAALPTTRAGFVHPSSSTDNGKRQRFDMYQSFLVSWNNFYYMTSPLGKVRSLAMTVILLSILGILLFHPPCYRRRARGMPLCRISRDLGIIAPLPVKRSSSNNNNSVNKKKTTSSSSSNLPPQERARVLLGFLTSGNDPKELQRRENIRRDLLLARDSGKQVCCLQDYLDDPEEHKQCTVVYSFLQGGNPDGTHLEFNKTYGSFLEYEQVVFVTDDNQPQRQSSGGHGTANNRNPTEREADITFLNVQDVNNVRKVFAWFDYASTLRMERGRKFDYVAFTNTNHSINVDRFVANTMFQSTTTIQHTYGGVQLEKSQCSYQQRQQHHSRFSACVDACPQLTNDLLMSDLVVLSRDLIDYCLLHSNLVQLNGVYPQDCPEIAVANLLQFHPHKLLNSTNLDGIITMT